MFYTPRPVVDYILRHTLVPRLSGATPEQVEKLTLLDPAAGSGAFLVAAFQILLEWHRQWWINHNPAQHPSAIIRTNHDWRLTRSKCRSILEHSLFGVDLDPTAVLVTRRILWLTMMAQSAPENANESQSEIVPATHETNRCASHVVAGHALIGAPFGQAPHESYANDVAPFYWNETFPDVSERGGFDLIVGNPPYRRERQFKQDLDAIAATPLGRYRSARMDLWYYFVHRGVELLREGGSLSFITNAYWLNGTGADKLMSALRHDVRLDELLLLHDQPVFPGVSGRHVIFRLTKTQKTGDVTIKSVPSTRIKSVESLLSDTTSLLSFTKSSDALFRDNQLDFRPDATEFLDRLRTFARLSDLGQIRQGIAENPAFVNRRTLERFPTAAVSNDWCQGEGVFTLLPAEVELLNLNPAERALLRPYHTLSDLGRYWLAEQPSRSLIYTTRDNCADIQVHPAIQSHLERFRAILESRRETQRGANHWWHLHWPRDERIWHAQKLVIPQMAIRPSISVANHPTYVSFSANVFVPHPGIRRRLALSLWDTQFDDSMGLVPASRETTRHRPRTQRTFPAASTGPPYRFFQERTSRPAR